MSFALDPGNRRAENVVVEAVIVAELELDDRHKGQAFGNKPDRQEINNSSSTASHTLASAAALEIAAEKPFGTHFRVLIHGHIGPPPANRRPTAK